jgi:hypothetical protein
MPESSGSTSNQRGDLPKLVDDGTTNNYGDWCLRCYHILRTSGLWKYIDGPESDSPVIPPLCQSQTFSGPDKDGVIREITLAGNNTERDKMIKESQPWFEGNDLLLSKIVSVAPELQMHLVEDKVYTKQAWIKVCNIYKPHNSTRAQSLKGDITSYRCTPDMDVLHWLTDIQRMYADLYRIDRHCMPNREYMNTILDNLPQTDTWEVVTTGLRDKLTESDDAATSAVLTQIITKVRDVCWRRSRNNPQANTHIFTAHTEAHYRAQKHMREPETPASSGSKHQWTTTNSRRCSNSYCGSQRGHT